MNMIMTFVLHPLSHYNFIIEPRARFLLSLLEHLTIDFPSHFILSIIDVFRDTVTRDSRREDELITGCRIPIYVYDGNNKMRGKIYSKML